MVTRPCGDVNVYDVWADIFAVAQSTISRYITFLTPFVEKATEGDRPAAEDAAEATRNAIADGRSTLRWSLPRVASSPMTSTI